MTNISIKSEKITVLRKIYFFILDKFDSISPSVIIVQPNVRQNVVDYSSTHTRRYFC